MICLDAPEFLGAFWGAIKIGAVPVPVNTLLRAADYRYVLDDSRARVAVVSAALLAEAGPRFGMRRAFATCWSRAGRRPRPSFLTRIGWREPPGASMPPDQPRRRRVLALFVGLDRPAQGGRPPPPRHGGLGRDLREAGARLPAHRQGVLRRQAVLRVRPRQRRVLPDERRRAERPLPAPADARRRLRAAHSPPPHALLRSAHALRRHAGGEGGGAPVRSLVPPPLRVGRRVPAGRPLPAVARALRRGDRRRDRHDGERSHLPVQPPGRGAAGVVGPPRPRLRVRDRRRRGAPRAGGRDRQPPRARRLHDGLLLEQARQDEGDALRPVDPDRGQVPPGRRRLLLVRRPRRRHAQGGRHLGLAGGGRGDADPASGGPRGRSRRTGRRRPAGQAPRLRRPQGPARASEALAAELRAFVKDKIAPYKYPRWIDFVPELPKTATGKIQRFKLRIDRPP